MKYFKLAVLSLMLGCVLMLSQPPAASAKDFCWDCYSTYQRGPMCYPLAGCSTVYGECIYDLENGSMDCPIPYLVTCCL